MFLAMIARVYRVTARGVQCGGGSLVIYTFADGKKGSIL